MSGEQHTFFDVEISPHLQTTYLGYQIALRKVPFQQRKKWKEFRWVQDYYDAYGVRHAVIRADGLRENG